ncbi:MAG: CoA pyrophosphatase [Thermodesulfobacteriota bacterium]
MEQEDFSQRLEAHSPVRLPGREVLPRAAVAVVVSFADAHRGPCVLLIKRARRAGDPWSGDMACPGGLVKTDDADARETALRELCEETGLCRTDLRYVARLSDIPTRTHRRLSPMVVTPFVFFLQSRVSTSLSAEAAERHWVALSYLADPANRGTMLWRFAGLTFTLPCYESGDRRIWGLTLILLDELLDLYLARTPGLPDYFRRLLHPVNLRRKE